MATKDTGGQKRATKSNQETDEVVEETSSDVADRKAKLDEDIDALLDEVDDVLESNSEEFVRSFVQKGGQ